MGTIGGSGRGHRPDTETVLGIRLQPGYLKLRGPCANRADRIDGGTRVLVNKGSVAEKGEKPL